MSVDLGINLDPTQPPALLEKKDRFRHAYLLGKTRSGESTFLFHLIRNDTGAQMIIDPAGGLAEQVKATTPKHRLIYVDRENPLKINPLQRQGYEWDDIAKEFTEVVNAVVAGTTSSPDATILHQEIIRNAVRVIPEKDIEFMSRFLNGRELRKRHAHDEYWKFFEQNREKVLAAGRVGARLSGFCEGVMRRFTIGKNEFEVEEVISGNKVAVFNLRGFNAIDQVYLGNLITHAVNSYFQLKATERSQPLFLYVDEFHRFISPFFDTMLSQCGKYNISLTLAHQDHEQIPKKLLSAILGNCHAKIVFSCGYAEAKRMSEE